jgi:putative ABC transport system ATP-binding protein
VTTSGHYLQTKNLCRTYRRGEHVVRALDNVSVAIDRSEFLSLVGSSGSGKTTLLNLLAGLDTPTSGSLEIGGISFATLSRRQLAAYRADKVGMIFQSFNLIAHYTALQNVETALYFTTTPPRDRRHLALAALDQLGLSDRLTHRPADLSGGEQQRVAVARAIVKKPEIIFADEPTGNLDYENANQIISLLTSLNNSGLTVVMVTHNLEIARQVAHRTIQLRYGRLMDPGGDALHGKEET